MNRAPVLAVSIAAITVLPLLGSCGDNETTRDTSSTPAAKPSGSTAATTQPMSTTTTSSTSATTKPGGETWSPSADGNEVQFLGFISRKPGTWIEQPPKNSMRAANFTVPGVDGSNAAQFIIWGMGGTVDANIERWEQQQFHDGDGNLVTAARQEFDIDGIPCTLVELQGSYRGMRDPQFKPDHTKLAAILVLDEELCILDLIGPSQTVDAHREGFETFLYSIRRTDS